MTLRLFLFSAVALSQLLVPAWLIHREEVTLTRGTPLRFKVVPFAPVDAFRGHYVALKFEAETIPDDFTATVEKTLPEAKTHPIQVYVTFKEDDQGYAKIVALSRGKPKPNQNLSLQLSLHYGWSVLGKNSYQILLPMNRFYLEEDSEAKASAIYNHHAGSANGNYAIVVIYEGHATIKDLFLEGMPVREYLLAHPLGK